MKESDCDKIVMRILALWDTGTKEDSSVIEMIHSEFGLPTEDAELALELTRTGLFHAAMIAKQNMYPNSNLNSNPIVISATKIGLWQLGCSEKFRKPSSKEKSWWKFW